MINLEEADNTKMMVGVMRPEEHSYANYDADDYFENTIVYQLENLRHKIRRWMNKGDHNP